LFLGYSERPTATRNNWPRRSISHGHFYGHIEVSKDPQGVYDGVLEFVMVNQKQASRLTIKPLSDEPLE
jgi:hypothetical protein